jgi:hypothetical protein
VELDGGAAIGCAAGAAVAADSAGEFCDGLPPVLVSWGVPGAAGAARGTGATGGIGAAEDDSALPAGCGDPLCGCSAFELFSG